DLIWVLLLFMQLCATYKASGNKIINVYTNIYLVCKELKPAHRRNIILCIAMTVFSSYGFYYVLPHVTTAWIFILSQLSLGPSLWLSYKYLGEKKGWARKWRGIAFI